MMRELWKLKVEINQKRSPTPTQEVMDRNRINLCIDPLYSDKAANEATELGCNLSFGERDSLLRNDFVD
jgi:hypothetical protein